MSENKLGARGEGQEQKSLQHVTALVFVDVTDVAELVVAHGGFEELAAIVADARLAELEGEEGLLVWAGIDKQRGAIVVCFCLHGVFFFEEKAHDADVDTKFICVRGRSVRVRVLMRR